jgi:hypothetical protein
MTFKTGDRRLLSPDNIQNYERTTGKFCDGDNMHGSLRQLRILIFLNGFW